MDQKKRLIRTKTIVDDAANIIEKLNMIAADDGIIAMDEIEMMNVITKNIDKYQKLLAEVMEDGEVDDSEVEKMLQLEEEIVNAVNKQANADGRVSVPEQELMDTLFDCLKNLNTLDDLQ